MKSQTQPKYDKQETYTFDINKDRSLSLIRRTGEEDVLFVSGSPSLLSHSSIPEIIDALQRVQAFLEDGNGGA